MIACQKILMNYGKTLKNLESKGMPKSALETVDVIFKKSKETNDNPNLIKSIIL